jgi:hypothetical protein
MQIQSVSRWQEEFNPAVREDSFKCGFCAAMERKALFVRARSGLPSFSGG